MNVEIQIQTLRYNVLTCLISMRVNFYFMQEFHGSMKTDDLEITNQIGCGDLGFTIDGFVCKLVFV